MITDAEEFFAKGCGRCPRFGTAECSTRLWLQGLLELRAILRSAGLSETVKWGHPCYMHAGRNIAILGAFRSDLRLSFMNAALLKDPEGILLPQGPNSRVKTMIRFTDNADVMRLAPVIRAYLAEAKDHAERGNVAPKEAVELELPDELVEVMDSDPELAEAFNALTPGRQKSYVIALNGAKKPETRFARIAKYRDMIFAGKGALDR